MEFRVPKRPAIPKAEKSSQMPSSEVGSITRQHFRQSVNLSNDAINGFIFRAVGWELRQRP